MQTEQQKILLLFLFGLTPYHQPAVLNSENEEIDRHTINKASDKHAIRKTFIERKEKRKSM